MELFSIYIMRLVKKYVPGVDGFTDLVAMDGRVKRWPDGNVIEVESKFASFDNHEKAILGALCSRPSNDGSIEIAAEIKSKVFGAGHPDQVLGASAEILRNLRKELWDIAEGVEAAFQKGERRRSL